jgi:hypothetical protein
MHNKWNYNRNTTNVLLKHQHKFIADCPEAPCVPKAEVIEKFGLYRSVGRGIKHRCETGYHMTGSPFAVCRHLGYWNVMFACTAGN